MMKQNRHSSKPEEKSTNRVFSVGSTAPEDNPFAPLLRLRKEESTPGNTSSPPAPDSPTHPSRTNLSGTRIDLSGQTATIMRTSKGHSGKTVTLISGLKLSNQTVEELLHLLKKRLGIGGTLELDDGKQVLLLQGDVRDRLQPELEKLHAKVKRSGG